MPMHRDKGVKKNLSLSQKQEELYAFNECAHACTQRGMYNTNLAPKTQRDSVRLGVGNVGDQTRELTRHWGRTELFGKQSEVIS